MINPSYNIFSSAHFCEFKAKNSNNFRNFRNSNSCKCFTNIYSLYVELEFLLESPNRHFPCPKYQNLFPASLIRFDFQRVHFNLLNKLLYKKYFNFQYLIKIILNEYLNILFKMMRINKTISFKQLSMINWRVLVHHINNSHENL